MAERGRRSAASLAVVAGSIDGRPKAPEELNAAQTEIWERTVANEAADVRRRRCSTSEGAGGQGRHEAAADESGAVDTPGARMNLASKKAEVKRSRGRRSADQRGERNCRWIEQFCRIPERQGRW
jgi:hypothetical protein